MNAVTGNNDFNKIKMGILERICIISKASALLASTPKVIGESRCVITEKIPYNLQVQDSKMKDFSGMKIKPVRSASAGTGRYANQ